MQQGCDITPRFVLGTVSLVVDRTRILKVISLFLDLYLVALWDVFGGSLLSYLYHRIQPTLLPSSRSNVWSLQSIHPKIWLHKQKLNTVL